MSEQGKASKIAHDIAAKAGTQIVRDGSAAALNWSDIAIACETTITIVVSAVVQMSGTSQPHALAAELIDTMTERAQKRVAGYLKDRGMDLINGN